jgi:hypothetical protein
MHRVLNVVLCHESAAEVDQLAGYWTSLLGHERLLIAYGGPRESFELIQFASKVFIDDCRLRTRDHQREGQSYTAVFKEVSEQLRRNSERIEFVTLFEFDHLPLVQGLNALQLERMKAEQADVMAHHLSRVDGTSHPHYLYYAANAEFARFFSAISIRSNPHVVLSMFGTGSCWKRDAFEAVAERTEPFPIYFEVYLPTVAHHLGFRLRDFVGQDDFVSNLGDRSSEITSAREQGAWALHPVKNLPEQVSLVKKV